MAGGVQSIIASFFAGAIFAAAWIILIDGIVSANQRGGPAFYWYYAIPAILCSITNILMNLVTSAQLSSRGGVFDDGSSTKVRVWFFVTVAATFCCICGAMWIIIQNYGVGTSNPWPGIALMLQTVLVTVAGFIFFFARGKRSSYGEL